MSEEQMSLPVGVDNSLEMAVTVALLKEKLHNLQENLNAANDKLEKLESDRDKALRWGVILLGTAVVSMAGWIFKLFERTLP